MTKFEIENMVTNQGNRMKQIRQAAVRFTLCAQELRLTPKEAHLAATLMERDAYKYLRPDYTDGKATPNQILFLESQGFRDVHEWDEKSAADMVDAISKNEWKVPDGIDPAACQPVADSATEKPTPLPAGDYRFTVTSAEKSFHEGSANMPPCFKMVLTLALVSAENPAVQGEMTVTLFLHRKTQWKLAQFFTAIGQSGEQARCENVIGSSGVCAVTVTKEYMVIEGETRMKNEIKAFYDPKTSPVNPVDSGSND